MSIVDSFKQDYPIVIQTTHGQVEVSQSFSIEADQPIRGMVKIIDHSNDRIYWFNFDNIVWIGRPK